MNRIRVAAIGSREITEKQAELFKKIGAFIVGRGDLISTGNAIGSDCEFARGGNSVNPSHVIIYLPWASYNQEFLHPRNKVLFNPLPEWHELARPFHGGYDKLTQGGQKMMQRNFGILNRADKCLAFLNHNKPGFGGTGFGWKVAEKLKIPRPDLNNKSFEEVVWFLEN